MSAMNGSKIFGTRNHITEKRNHILCLPPVISLTQYGTFWMKLVGHYNELEIGTLKYYGGPSCLHSRSENIDLSGLGSNSNSIKTITHTLIPPSFSLQLPPSFSLSHQDHRERGKEKWKFRTSKIHPKVSHPKTPPFMNVSNYEEEVLSYLWTRHFFILQNWQMVSFGLFHTLSHYTSKVLLFLSYTSTHIYIHHLTFFLFCLFLTKQKYRMEFPPRCRAYSRYLTDRHSRNHHMSSGFEQ